MISPSNISLPKPPPLFSFRSKRFRVLLMIGFHMFCQGIMKTNMSMAMVCMVNTTEERRVIDPQPIIHRVSSCNITQNTQSDLHYSGTFLWSSSQQSSIFASFFWGGLVSVTICTWMSDKFGPSRVLFVVAIMNVIGSLLTPLAAQMGVNWLIAVRSIMGFGQGVQYPLGATVAATWFPIQEKSMANAVYTNGNQLSYVIALLFSSQLCQMESIGGWKGIFYLSGILGFFMCILWAWIVRDTPLHTKDISEEELNYIVGNLRKKRVVTSTPWLKMFTSPIVLTLLLCTIGQALTIISLTTYLPKYFKQVLQMDLTANGFWSALPFIAQTLMKFLVGGIADGMKKCYPNRLDTITKMSNSLATFGTSLCLLSVSLVSCGHSNLAVFFVTLGTSCLSGYVGGYFTSMISVAPMHTAALNSVTRFFGQAASVVAPYMVGYITVNDTPEQWTLVFCIIGAVLSISGVAFLIFGTVEPLPWSLPPSEENQKKIENVEV